jgi:hypothetical protein
MFCGIIGAVACWFVSKSVIATIGTFYLLTGIRKSSLWLGLPRNRRFVFLPPMIQSLTFRSFIVGALFWPVVLKGCGGDPLHQYFMELERSGMSHFEKYKFLKKQDEIESGTYKYLEEYEYPKKQNKIELDASDEKKM